MAWFDIVKFADGRYIGVSANHKPFNDGIVITLQMTAKYDVTQANGEFKFIGLRDCKIEFNSNSLLHKVKEIFQDGLQLSPHYKNLILSHFIREIDDNYIYFNTSGVDSVSHNLNGSHYWVERYDNDRTSWTDKIFIGRDFEMKQEIEKVLSPQNSDFSKYNFSSLSKPELKEIINYIQNIIKE